MTRSEAERHSQRLRAIPATSMTLLQIYGTLLQTRALLRNTGRAASGGALAPEPLRATRIQPEGIRNITKKIKIRALYALEGRVAEPALACHVSHVHDTLVCVR